MKCWEMKTVILFSFFVLLQVTLQSRYFKNTWPCIQSPKHSLISKLLFPDSSKREMSQTFLVSLILQLNENVPLSLNIQLVFEKHTQALWLCFTLHPVCYSRLERRKPWATPLLIGYGTPPWFCADTAGSAEMIKGFGVSEEQSTEFWMCELLV